MAVRKPQTRTGSKGACGAALRVMPRCARMRAWCGGRYARAGGVRAVGRRVRVGQQRCVLCAKRARVRARGSGARRAVRGRCAQARSNARRARARRRNASARMPARAQCAGARAARNAFCASFLKIKNRCVRWQVKKRTRSRYTRTAMRCYAGVCVRAYAWCACGSVRRGVVVCACVCGVCACVRGVRRRSKGTQSVQKRRTPQQSANRTYEPELNRTVGRTKGNNRNRTRTKRTNCSEQQQSTKRTTTTNNCNNVNA